ncbi:MAG: putative hydrogenase nickel incorporation protein HypB [Promethearchaeota archaeon]|nr:MAG: putative hydrogenase nickel incorporation protein HypB [Candidatus Lokiarchaeota archaeon]
MADEKEEKFDRVMELESRKLAKEVDREFVIETQKQVEKNNDLIAVGINDRLKERGIKSFDFVGAIGAGKTALIERLSEKFGPDHKILVICGDIATRVDADRIQKEFVKAIQINTGRECALNAYHVDKVLKNVNIDEFDVVFVENVGNLICPSEFMLGMDKRITVVSVTEGEWVVEKHPLLFKMSDIAVINKIDLAERLESNTEKMVKDAKDINPNIKVVLTSARTGEGVDELLDLLNT